MAFYLGSKSEEKLIGVHPDLVRVVRRAITISQVDFTVLEGLRTDERQKRLFEEETATSTLNSRHLKGKFWGHAVDLGAYVNGRVSYDWKYYFIIEKAMKLAAKLENVPIEWGGDWETKKDGPHWQLPWSKYPK